MNQARLRFPQERFKRFNYKATSPLFAGKPFNVHVQRLEDKVKVWAETSEGGLAMTGEVEIYKP
jgi:hydroxyacyl-ACP dehydratase HTD2-like protein with hotdog domain